MKFTEEELEIIKNALISRMCQMLRDAELYKKQQNLEAQKDCYNEFRKSRKLYDKIRDEWHDNCITMDC